MKRLKKLICCFYLCLAILYVPWSFSYVYAEVNASQEPVITVVYSSPDNKIGEHQRSLDMLLSHFSQPVTFINASDLEESDLNSTTHLFYYGQVKDELPAEAVNILNQFKGTKVVIGYNQEQFTDFEFVKGNGEPGVSKLTLTSQEKEIQLPEDHQIFNVKDSNVTHTWISAQGKNESYPLFIQNQSNYYYADYNLAISDAILLGEVLHEVFDVEHQNIHPAAMRLEDVNPLLDPDLLSQSANVLFEKGIPFMVSVTPIYKDPATGENYYLSDSPGLVSVLQHLQQKGATILLHGYTDQSALGKSGDGFEFWSPNDTSEKKDKTYVKNRIKKGIIELQKNGLNPYAFETPHYAISQEGYEAVADFFPTYIGQLQLSNENWKHMEESPFLTRPSFIHGMQLLPETLRYIQDGEPHSITDVMSRAEHLSLARDSVMSAFYHPYLGAEGLEEMLEYMTTIPNLDWIDLAAVGDPAPYLNDTETGTQRLSQVDSARITDYLFLMNPLWLPLLVGGVTAGLMLLVSYLLAIKIRHEEK
ncbi:DUF2334 domain-containing protein [Thalassobacillus devorans]|uniref:DUF2334 domain-containing protein n=1 Tax=Thalassobacillus devorans TaxID=279813 RepID=UPI00048D5CFB|nr:DUF2334 domain-containing protein [Thalassobacillus devorans]